MLSIIGAIISAGLKWALSYFMPSKDQKIGQLEVKSQEQGQAFNDIKKAQDAVAAVKSGSGCRLLDDPVNRDR